MVKTNKQTKENKTMHDNYNNLPEIGTETKTQYLYAQNEYTHGGELCAVVEIWQDKSGTGGSVSLMETTPQGKIVESSGVPFGRLEEAHSVADFFVGKLIANRQRDEKEQAREEQRAEEQRRAEQAAEQHRETLREAETVAANVEELEHELLQIEIKTKSGASYTYNTGLLTAYDESGKLCGIYNDSDLQSVLHTILNTEEQRREEAAQ